MPNPFLVPVQVTLRDLDHMELANWVHHFAEFLAVHPDHQAPFPPTVPDAKELMTDAAYHVDLTNQAATGHRGKKTERDLNRPRLEANATITVNWAVARAYRENNPNLIANLGLEPKKPTPRTHIHPLVDAPHNPKVGHGSASGSVLASCNKVDGAAVYQLWATAGDPSIEENWTLIAQSPGCKPFEAHGLEAPKAYHFKFRCYGHAGYGAWSAILALTVI